MKTIVLDDDPTGTQSAIGVRVLLQCTTEAIARELAAADSVYVQTNSRAIPVEAAVSLVRSVRESGLAAARVAGDEVRFVLRGDSTLRGHVFAETEQFLEPDGIILFVPAFPAGGRTTVNGIHRVRVDGVDLPAGRSEYADDPVFGYRSSRLTDFVSERSRRRPVGVDIDIVRAGGLAGALDAAPAGSVVVPDVHDDADIRLVAAAVDAARRPVVVRCAAPLAAALAGVPSSGLLPVPLVAERRPTLLVCGSHTTGATAQLERLRGRWGEPSVVDTRAALTSPGDAAAVARSEVERRLDAGPLAVLASDRLRAAEHDTLGHGARVMDVLTRVVRAVLPRVDIVVAKGGITSAEVARVGLGATSATVLGQVLPGVPVWSLDAADGRQILYVVVPGNVGGPDALHEVLRALRLD